MLRTRILLVIGSAAIIWLLFLLPKVVVENDAPLSGNAGDSVSTSPPDPNHASVPQAVQLKISDFRHQFQASASNEKNAIFADSLAKLYVTAGKYDSSAWFAEVAAKFFNTTESWTKAGDQYYQAYSFAVDQARQQSFAEKARESYDKVLAANPHDLDVKTNKAMTYLGSGSPMQGIAMLREVIAENPRHEPALFNMGMLSIQSGQYDRAVERLNELLKVNPNHTQGHLLLGIALMNTGEKVRAREEFVKVKNMDKDPAVQATVDSYLQDLK
ncbi:MAG TPA: tetratricopeptide repeat protein [Chryseolinea sp.]|nr:tetratricopeptide repeat protein [Chryseolinea sp.]